MIKQFVALMFKYDGDIAKVSEETGFETFFIYNSLVAEFPDRTAKQSWVEYFLENYNE